MKYSVGELVEIVSRLSTLDWVVVCDILGGRVRKSTKHFIRSYKNIEAVSRKPDLIHAIANWNLDYPAHKDDAILALLEELLEDVKCQLQPGKQAEAETQS